MSERVKKIRVKQADGKMSDYIPLGTDAQYVDMNNGSTVEIELSKSIKYYDCVADMKADTTLNEGGAARTLGYYEPGDGGSAIYRIVDTSSDLTVALNNRFICWIKYR